MSRKKGKFILTNLPKWVIIQIISSQGMLGESRALKKDWSLHMFETVKKLLVDELQIDPSTVTPDAELSADLGINSIELANLVMLCEDKFDITIDDEDLHRFITVGDVVEYLDSL